MSDDLQPSPSPGPTGPPSHSPDAFDRCPYCHEMRGSVHATGCPGRAKAPLSIRLTIAEYERLCGLARHEERTVSDVIRRAVRILLARAAKPTKEA